MGDAAAIAISVIGILIIGAVLALLLRRGHVKGHITLSWEKDEGRSPRHEESEPEP